MTHTIPLDTLATLSTGCLKLSALQAIKPKARTAHHVMEMKSLHNDLQDLAHSLGAVWKTFFPDHWDMKDWSFYLHTDGSKLRWSARNGLAPQGLSIRTNHTSLLFACAYAQTLGTVANHTDFKKDAERLKKLALTKDVLHPFILRMQMINSTREDFFTAYGRTPVDAFARLMISGENQHALSCFLPSGVDSSEALTRGVTQAKDRLQKEARDWSGSLAIFTQLYHDPMFKTLLRGNIKISPKDLNGYNAMFYQEGAWVKLQNAFLNIKPPKTSLRAFMVHDNTAQAWFGKAFDAPTAMIARQLYQLISNPTDKKYPNEWVAVPLGTPEKTTVQHSLM